MPEPTYQTVRLSRGKHASPQDGACVMELASMLAGERFDDHPRAVCNVIGVVLRGYNDGVDDDRRQDLYRYAADVVGTRDRAARRRRLELCTSHFGLDRRGLPMLPGSRMRAIGRAALVQGRLATDESHRRFLAFVDELIAAGNSERVPAMPPVAPERSAHARR